MRSALLALFLLGCSDPKPTATGGSTTTPPGTTTTPGTTSSGLTTSTTFTPTGTTSGTPVGTTSGTTSGTTATAACLAGGAALAALNVPGDGNAVFCHFDATTGLLDLRNDPVATCLTHIGHAQDAFATALCAD